MLGAATIHPHYFNTPLPSSSNQTPILLIELFLQPQLSLTLLHISPSFLITQSPAEIATLATSSPQPLTCTSGPRTTLLSPIHVPPTSRVSRLPPRQPFFFLPRTGSSIWSLTRSSFYYYIHTSTQTPHNRHHEPRSLDPSVLPRLRQAGSRRRCLLLRVLPPRRL